MEKMKLYTKSFTDEKNDVYHLDYSMLIHSAEFGKIYGVEIVKTDATGRIEKNEITGISENYEETEQFIGKLVEGVALPIELEVLCDEFITEQETGGKESVVQAAS